MIVLDSEKIRDMLVLMSSILFHRRVKKTDEETPNVIECNGERTAPNNTEEEVVSTLLSNGTS